MMIVLKVLKTSDEEKVKGQLLRMVHSLFLQVFFSYETCSISTSSSFVWLIFKFNGSGDQ